MDKKRVSGVEKQNMKIIEVKENVFLRNDIEAEKLRKELSGKGIFLLNVTSSPGSGKTTLLTALINILKQKLEVAAMDVDIETDCDAVRVAEKTGIRSVQVHNGGLCHIDADMVRRAVKEADFGNPDLIVLENIGNLVCPAEFDTGAHLNMMLLSVPEGDDKPLKYPLMFEKSDFIVVTKTDVSEIFDFNREKFIERVRNLNKNAELFFVSAKSGDGIENLAERIYNIIKSKKIILTKGENYNARNE